MSAKSDSVLVDHKPGSLDRGDKSYLVFVMQDFEALFETNEAVSLSNVSVSFLQDPNNGVLPPESVEVWGGMEKDKLVSLGKTSPLSTENKSAEKGLITLAFPKQDVRYVRIKAKNVGRLPLALQTKAITPTLCVDEIALN
jgi:hypothetical protein